MFVATFFSSTVYIRSGTLCNLFNCYVMYVYWVCICRAVQKSVYPFAFEITDIKYRNNYVLLYHLFLILKIMIHVLYANLFSFVINIVKSILD